MNYKHSKSITEVIEILSEIGQREKEQGLVNLTNSMVCEGTIQVMDNLLNVSLVFIDMPLGVNKYK